MSGTRVKMSASRLRKELLSTPEDTILVVHNEQQDQGPWKWTGYAFATAWNYEGGMWCAVFWDSFLLLNPHYKAVFVGSHSLLWLIKPTMAK